MELILKKDVENLGFTDDIVTVKNGYGRNYLIPQGYAVLATSSAKKVLAEKLNGLEVKIAAKAGEGDKLFGSVNNADVAEALEKAGVSIDKKYITVAGGNIKRTGQYEAKVRFHRDVIANLTFDVIAEAKS